MNPSMRVLRNVLIKGVPLSRAHKTAVKNDEEYKSIEDLQQQLRQF